VKNLNPKMIVAWLRPYMDGKTYCNGKRMDETAQRWYHRRRANATATLESFDRFCTTHDLHMGEFFRSYKKPWMSRMHR